jgi:hypothetical protein
MGDVIDDFGKEVDRLTERLTRAFEEIVPVQSNTQTRTFKLVVENGETAVEYCRNFEVESVVTTEKPLELISDYLKLLQGDDIQGIYVRIDCHKKNK